ncbi:aldehyde dehydrogenase family protein [Mycobacterium nebraskense]|uniref:aldehyde dehydrogenase family protein n=1 Tax=Mycobacterium nebraskense TaxID=244292 RepID=UPI000A913AF6
MSGGHAAPTDELAPDMAGGYYIEPTLLVDVDPHSPVAQEEVFGPVLAITPFDTEDQAVDIANATPYGLGAFVQTRDVARVHRIAPLLQAGTISVNGASGLPPGGRRSAATTKVGTAAKAAGNDSSSSCEPKMCSFGPRPRGAFSHSTVARPVQ